MRKRQKDKALRVFLYVVLAAIWTVGAVSIWIHWRASHAPVDLGPLLALTLSIIALVLGPLKKPPPPTLSDAKSELGGKVKAEWNQEMHSRGLSERHRMAVRWQRVDGSDLLSALASELGESGQLEQLTTCFGQQVRAGKVARLVVTGDMGAGKTAACVLLTDELGEDSPLVPVPFQLASWDPGTGLLDWMIDELLANYPFLHDCKLAGDLVRGQILPILDGLDELRDPAAALRRITAELVGRSFVLTSRTQEFEAANGGGVFREALIAQLQPLQAEEVCVILGDHAQGNGKLGQLVDELDRDPTGLMAEALRTPFMLSLAIEAGQDFPPRLLDASGPDAVEAIQRYLLGTLVAEAYAPVPTRGKYDPDIQHKAARYLGFLARNVAPPGTYRLAWWHLHKAVPRAVFFCVAIFNAVVTCSALAAAFFDLFQRPWLGFWIGLAAGIIGAFIVELIPPENPRRARPSLRSFRVPTPYALLRTLGFGLTGGAACGAMAWFLFGPVYYALIGATLSGITFALARYVSQPSDPMKVVTPDSLLRTDRTVVLYAFVAGGIAGALTGAYLGGSFSAGHRHGLDDLHILTLPAPAQALLGALGGFALSALGLGLMALGSASWGRFILTRMWLAARGSVPFDLMEFLSEARRRGVLRQVNGYYEFRHRLLQDYLAALDPGDPPASVDP